MDTIVCHPKKESLAGMVVPILAGMIVGTAIIAGSLIVLCSWITGPLLSTGLKAACFLIGGIATAIFSRWFCIKESDRYTWTLTNTTLIRGRSRPTSISLSEVKQVILGLPNGPGDLFRLAQFSHPQLWDVVEAAKVQSVLLKLDGDKMLPLHLHRTVNGTELMLELIRRLAHLVDRNYTFTKDELKRLRRAEYNSII